MAINFPNSPSVSDTHVVGGTTWQWDGTAWNIVGNSIEANKFTSVTGDTGSIVADATADTFKVAGGTDISTSITGDVLTVNFTGASGGTTQNLFETFTADQGSTTANITTDTLTIAGGTNLSTVIATDSDIVTINMDSFPINFLSDVDTSSNPPNVGQVLKWDGAKWAPGADATSGGAGTDADTLDGFDSQYFLNYNNLQNTPAVLTLSSLSVGVENTPAGNGAISYDNTTGQFKFTPPTAAGLGALTAEVNDLSSAVTWANVPDANITQSSVTQHQAALSITESQISDLQSYLTSVSASDLSAISIDALSDVDTTTSAPSSNDVLAWDGAKWAPSSAAGGGDANQNAFSNIAVAGQNTIQADTTTDTLNLIGSGGINITTNDSSDTVTIGFSATGLNFNTLQDANSASLNVALIYEPAIAMLRVSAVGQSAYLFNSHYSGNNPTIYALAGTTIAFDLSSAGSHPFEIQDPTSNPYNVGLVYVDSSGGVQTGSNAQGKDSGVLYWRIPESISGNYRYQCTAHPAMVGAITIKRLSVI